jgi:hypothetical protein
MREDLTEAEREGAGIDGEARLTEELKRENGRLREALAATQAEAKRLAWDLGQRYDILIAPAMIRPPRRRGDRESAIDLAAEIARARDAAALAAEQHELALAASQAHLNLVQTANAILATSEARLRLALAAGRLGTWELVRAHASSSGARSARRISAAVRRSPSFTTISSLPFIRTTWSIKEGRLSNRWKPSGSSTSSTGAAGRTARCIG